VTNEHPEDTRAARLADIRARRDSPERLAHISELESAPARRKTAKPSGSHRKTPENSTHMFGHPWPEWFEMRDAVFDYLCVCAAKRQRASYGEIWTRLADALGKDPDNNWRQLPYVLEYVSRRSLEEFEILATALVIYDSGDVDSGPGPGFFRLAASLGLLADADSPPEGIEWSMTDRQRTFWEQQRDAMFDRFSGN
jgi:hypothetical protein